MGRGYQLRELCDNSAQYLKRVISEAVVCERLKAFHRRRLSEPNEVKQKKVCIEKNTFVSISGNRWRKVIQPHANDRIFIATTSPL